MRTKTTLIKAVKFVNNCKFIFSFRKNIFQKNIFTILFCLITTISFAQSESCNSTLIAENNRNIRSTPLDGTYYSMILTNNGVSTDTYVLEISNVNSSCANTDGSSTSGNISIKADFIDPEKNKISEITINPGQSYNFYIHVTVPSGTNINKWSCDQVTAKSKNCSNQSDTVLHTLVINPVND
ncbi:hypothetical protein [Flavobacterium sp. LC2016-12]|uniref:hypothetical protein n=1 Tax=Flavobacterium sp. LC2016-12 TaxID=2783794 RepID=UPI00188ABF8A|nr:hypothetical protein [Flavobacterium sp. LC2016-12]MBF4467678.1 hypothetical protein [Flavobacterium sp. LC2016-12]